MTLFLSLFAVQAVLGALDNLLHHELTEKLPARASARHELALHGARELIYAVVFVVLAWLSPHGLWAWALAGLLAIEIVITIADFLEEDRTRTLPPFERALHTMLALIFGALLALGAPIWAQWASQPTALIGEHRGLFSYFFSLCALGVAAWGVRNLAASAALFGKAQEFARRAARPSGRTVLITGATGFLGEALTRRALAAGDAVIVLSRDPRRADALFDGRVLAVRKLDLIPSSMRIDAIVNLAGAGVANAPWTRARKRAIVQTRLQALKQIEALIERLDAKPEVLVAASAVGFYGDRGEQTLTESALRGAGFTGDSCEAVEQAARRAAGVRVRLALMRFGLILGRDGGGWPKLALPLHLGLGAVFGSGRQFMAWIHKEDALRLIETAIADARLSGAVNAVAPQETRHGAVMRAAADALGVRFLLPIPAFAVRAMLGEMSHLFLDSQRAIPRAAAAAGFQFAFPTIEDAAEELLNARRSLRLSQLRPPKRDAPHASRPAPAEERMSASIEVQNSVQDTRQVEIAGRALSMSFKAPSFIPAALMVLTLWSCQSPNRVGATPPAAMTSDASVCATTVASASNANALALFQGAASCARQNRHEDTNFLMIIGQIRALADLSILTPLNEVNTEKAGELYTQLYYHFGGLGFDEFYRTPASVSALEARIRNTELSLAKDYDPGWVYAPSSKTDIYSDILSNTREHRIWQMRNMALKLQDDEYYEVSQALAALQRSNPVLTEGTRAYEEHFRLMAQLQEAARDIPELPPPEDTVPYARLNEQDPELAPRQAAIGFNGPASHGAHLFRSETEVRQSWLAVALSHEELDRLISRTDFSTQVLVGYSFGKRMNASGKIMISALDYRERSPGYSISVRIGVVPESCGVAFAESYPFVVGVANAVADAEVRGYSASNFPDECGPIVSGAPTSPR